MITASQWKKAVSPLLPDTTSWALRGKLAYQTPVDWILLGVHGEGTRHIDQVRISSFVMPLFVPLDHLIHDHSQRVPDGSAYVGLDDPDRFNNTVNLAIGRLPTQQGAFERIAQSNTEEAPYAELLLGRTHEAERKLSEEFAPGDTRRFAQDARQRRRAVFGALVGQGPEAAVDLLRVWRLKTVTAVRVA